LAFIILAFLAFTFSAVCNLIPKASSVCYVYNGIIAIAQLVTLFVWLGQGEIESGAGNPDNFNDVKRFYTCNQTTGNIQLQTGTIMFLQRGNHYPILWLSWILIYILGTVAIGVRHAFFGGDGDCDCAE
jgi:hypothetical protein